MPDITEIQASMAVKIAGGDETNFADVNTAKELKTISVPNQTGLNVVLNLTTTAQEAKVGTSALSNRKAVIVQALANNIKWGYDSTCPFDLFKNQFLIEEAGENCKIYLKMSTGTGDAAVGEK